MQERTMPQILKNIRATLRDAGIYKKNNRLVILPTNKQQDHLLFTFLTDFIKDPSITIRIGTPKKDEVILSSYYLEQQTEMFLNTIFTNTKLQDNTIHPFAYVNAEELNKIADHYNLNFTPIHNKDNLVESVEQFARGSKRATIKSIEHIQELLNAK